MTTKTVNLHHKIEFLPSMVRTIAINLCSSDLSREWRKSNNIKEPIKFGECFYVDLLHEDHVRIIDQLMILEYKHRKSGRKEEMTWDDCYALKEICKKQAEFYFYK